MCGNHESYLLGPAGGSWDQIWPPGLFENLPGPQNGPFWDPGRHKRPKTRPKCVFTMTSTQSDKPVAVMYVLCKCPFLNVSGIGQREREGEEGSERVWRLINSFPLPVHLLLALYFLLGLDKVSPLFSFFLEIFLSNLTAFYIQRSDVGWGGGRACKALASVAPHYTNSLLKHFGLDRMGKRLPSPLNTMGADNFEDH